MSAADSALTSMAVRHAVRGSGNLLWVELWGARLFGDPCRECDFDWSLTPGEAVTIVAGLARDFADATARATGSERGAGWTVAGYASHVADNLRMWAERVQAVRLAGQSRVSGYDPDRLADARGYEAIPLAAALWSLSLSASAWVDVLNHALDEHIVLDHATRGRQSAKDIARNNAHDAFHHLWDIRRIIEQQTD